MKKQRNLNFGDRVVTTNDWFARLWGTVPKGSTGVIVDTASSVLVKVKWDHQEDPSHVLYTILERSAK